VKWNMPRRTSVAAMLAAGTMIVGGTAANAGARVYAGDCTNGYVNAFETSSDTVIAVAYAGSHVVHLSRGWSNSSGTWVYWARLVSAPRGSTVWLDWSDDAGASHAQCGAETVDGSQGDGRWTWAVPEIRDGGTGYLRSFRAGAWVNGYRIALTGWHSD